MSIFWIFWYKIFNITRAKDNIKNIVCEVCGAGEGKIKLEKILKKIRAV